MSCLIKCENQYIHFDKRNKMKLGSKMCAKIFDEQKAKNLIKNPPNSMKKYKFEIEQLSGEKTECEIKQKRILMKATEHAKKIGCYVDEALNAKNDNKSIIKTEDSNTNINNWLEKLHSCNGIKNEARERMEYLYKKLSLIDQAQDVFLHVIENNEHPNAVLAYKERMNLFKIRKKRRQIKNELAIVQMILSNNTSSKLYERLVNISKSIQNPDNLDVKYTKDLADNLMNQFERM